MKTTLRALALLLLAFTAACTPPLYAAPPTTGQFLFQQKTASGPFLPFGVTPVTGQAFGWDGTNVVMLPASSPAWGGITGTLSTQTDLQNALNAKLSLAGVLPLGGFSSITGTLPAANVGDLSATYLSTANAALLPVTFATEAEVDAATPSALGQWAFCVEKGKYYYGALLEPGGFDPQIAVHILSSDYLDLWSDGGGYTRLETLFPGGNGTISLYAATNTFRLANGTADITFPPGVSGTLGTAAFLNGATLNGATMTVADSGGDSTTWPLLSPTQSGVNAPKTSGALTYNAATGTLSSAVFSGAGTSLTGTAAGLTAGTVTTNANLTGDVTSTGNATTIGASKVTNAMLAGSIDLTTKVTGVLPAANGGASQTAGYAMLADQKASGTAGGTSTTTTWHTRVLNTELADTGNFCSLASNQFTLTTGTYRIRAVCPSYNSLRQMVKIYNVTDSANTLTGASAYLVNSEVNGRFTLSGTKTFELRHYIQSGQATNGLGVEANSGEVETYSVVEIWKE